MQEYIRNLISVTLAATLIITAASAIGCGGSQESTIAFQSDRDGYWEIYVMNADGTGQTRLTNNPVYDSNPSWSPDGERIAFQSDRDGNWEIYVMNADGTGHKSLRDTLMVEPI